MHDSDAPASTPPFDAAIAALAWRQHGVVARAQLVALGLGRGAIARRLETGRLHRVYRGVYAVGHRLLSAAGRAMAAVLACGDGAALSHRSAAQRWDLLRTNAARIDVSGARRRRLPGIAMHRTQLAPSDTTIHEGIPITTVARTLLDLADVAPARHVERALDRAEIIQRFDGRAVDAVLVRANGRRGASVLRAALEAHRGGPVRTRSELEEAFLALVRRTGLPAPLTNVRVAGFEVDAYWPRHRLAVELDGRRYHHTARAFEADRQRDVHLLKAGVRTVRVTDKRLNEAPHRIEDDLRRLVVDSGRPRPS